MPKRNQYNRLNFNQLGPLAFTQPIKFSTFDMTAQPLTVLMEQNPLPIFAGAIDASDPTTWPIDAPGVGALNEGDSGAQWIVLSDVTLPDGIGIGVQILSTQITVASIILATTICSQDNGLYVTTMLQVPGSVLFALNSNGTNLANAAIGLGYLILNKA